MRSIFGSSRAQGASIPRVAVLACHSGMQGDARLQHVVRCSQSLQVRQIAKPRRECTVKAKTCTHQP